MVYTSHKEEVWQPIVREFESRTGIWVDVVVYGSSELLERLDQEKEHPQADVMFGGGGQPGRLPGLLRAPISAPTGGDPPQYRSEDGLWTPSPPCRWC